MQQHNALREALSVAVHSPSSHNSQAWELKVTDNDDGTVLALGIDRNRELTALPGHRYEMLLSLGAYWYGLAVALRARGWALDCDAEPAASGRATIRGRMVPAEVSPDSKNDAALITERRTDRGAYAETPIRSDIRDALADAARTRPEWAPATPLPNVQLLTGSDELAEVAELTRQFAPRDFLHRKAWKETVHYLHRDAVAASASDGFSYGQIFGRRPWPIDHLVVALTSPALMPFIGRAGLADKLARGLASAVETGPGFLVLTAPNTVRSSSDWIWAGADMHRMWLAATRVNLGLHPVSVLLQHDDSRTVLEQRLGLSGRAFFAARIGHRLPGRVGTSAPRRDPLAVLSAPTAGTSAAN